MLLSWGVLLKKMCLDIVTTLFYFDRKCIGDLACFFFEVVVVVIEIIPPLLGDRVGVNVV